MHWRRSLMAGLIAILPVAAAPLRAETASQPSDDDYVPEASPVPAEPAATAAPDPYPFEDAGRAAAASAAATAAAPTAASATPLRGALDDRPLRSVVRPADPAQSAKLPAVTPALPPVAREKDARAEYLPEGISLGDLRLNATSTSGIGGLSNSKAGEEVYLRQSLEVIGQTDWDANSVDFKLRGAYQRPFVGNTSDDKPEADVIVNGRFDLTEVDRVTAGAAWTLRDDDDYDESVVHTLSASLGYQRSAGLIGLKTDVSLDHEAYSTATDRDNTAISTALRLSLDNGATLSPFAEASLFLRRYDRTEDANGYRRSSVGGEGKLGLKIDGDLVSGEIAAGYALEAPEDDKLPMLRGLIGEASLTFAPSELVTAELTAATAFEPTSTAGASGSIKRSSDLTVTYWLAPNAYVFGGAGLSWQDYVGVDLSELTGTLKSGVGYKLNATAEIGITGTHKIVDSSAKNGDYRESTIEATLTLRR